MKNLGLGISCLFVLLFFSCNSMSSSIQKEHIENDFLVVGIAEFTTSRDGFEQLTIILENASNEELEFSTDSYFEDSTGRYYMVYLPENMFPNSIRNITIRRTYYIEKGTTSFRFTGNFSGVDLNTEGGFWEIKNNDLDVKDIYLTLKFKLNDKVYTNSYHLAATKKEWDTP